MEFELVTSSAVIHRRAAAWVIDSFTGQMVNTALPSIATEIRTTHTLVRLHDGYLPVSKASIYFQDRTPRPTRALWYCMQFVSNQSDKHGGAFATLPPVPH